MSSYETVRARRISFADVEALAHQGAEPFEAYRAKVTGQHGLTLTPVTLTPQPVGGKGLTGEEFPHHVVFQAVPDQRPNAMHPHTVDRSRPVGYAVDFTSVSAFNARSKFTLFTSEEAERSAVLVRRAREPEQTRETIYVADEQGEELRLTPVYGARLSVGVVIKGIGSEEVVARAEAALQAEFGDALGPVRSVTSQSAEDLRVDAFASSAKEEVLARNVLAAEVGYLTTGKPYVEEAEATAGPVEPA